MIGFIQGSVILSDSEETIVLTVNGIGYTLQYSKLLAQNTKVSFFVSQIIREDSNTLYAFDNYLDKKVFETLLKVNGVGPKSAYNLVTAIGTDSVIKAVQLESPQILKKAPGVGPKAAAQILLTLKDKIHLLLKYQAMNLIDDNSSTEFHKSTEQKFEDGNISPIKLKTSKKQSNLFSESMEALVELGFKDYQILPVLKEALESDQSISKSEELVEHVLKSL